MTKSENEIANSDPAGGCCCSGKKNSAQVPEASVEPLPASDPLDRAPGREEPTSSCCQSSKGAVTKKGERA